MRPDRKPSNVRAWANEALRHVAVGDALTFDIPVGQPERRMTYQIVAAAAHRIWGPGCYRISTQQRSRKVMIKRIAPGGGADPATVSAASPPV